MNEGRERQVTEGTEGVRGNTPNARTQRVAALLTRTARNSNETDEFERNRQIWMKPNERLSRVLNIPCNSSITTKQSTVAQVFSPILCRGVRVEVFNYLCYSSIA